MTGLKPARLEASFPVRRARAAGPAHDRIPESLVPPSGELGLVTRDLGRRLRAEIVLVARGDGSESARCVCSWGAPAGLDHLALPQGRGFVGRVLVGGHAAAEPLPPGPDNGLGVPASGVALTYAAGAPVRFPGGPPHALLAGFSGVPPGDPAELRWTVESYARLVALSLHDPGVLGGLFEAARRDGLTGCLTYDSLRQELRREIRRSERHGPRLSCCFVDLDNFKEINERHGHLDANYVLAGAAATLAAGMRASDTLGRFGGDEFVAILPETGEAEARTLAQRLRSRLRQTLTVTAEPLDASIGVAEWRTGVSADGLLAAADRALRAAKAAGGGTITAESDTIGAGG